MGPFLGIYPLLKGSLPHLTVPRLDCKSPDAHVNFCRASPLEPVRREKRGRTSLKIVHTFGNNTLGKPTTIKIMFFPRFRWLKVKTLRLYAIGNGGYINTHCFKSFNGGWNLRELKVTMPPFSWSSSPVFSSKGMKTNLTKLVFFWVVVSNM